MDYDPIVAHYGHCLDDDDSGGEEVRDSQNRPLSRAKAMLMDNIRIIPLARVWVPMKKLFQKATTTAFLPLMTTPLSPLVLFPLGKALRPSFLSAGVRTRRVVGKSSTIK